MKAVLFYHKSDHNRSILISHPLCLNPMVDIKGLLETSCDTKLISHPLCLNTMVEIKDLLEISCDTKVSTPNII